MPWYHEIRFVYILEKHSVISRILSLCGVGHMTFGERAKAYINKPVTVEVRLRELS